MTRDVVSRQALVIGRIVDAITGSVPRAIPLVRLLHAADGAVVRDVAITVRPDGWYVVHGDPARMPRPRATVLRVAVAAPGYAAATADLALTAAQLARARRMTAGRSVAVIAAAPFVADVALAPLAVALAGRVVRAEDPATAVPDAEVAITAPAAAGSAISGADGRYRLGALPLGETLAFRVSAPGRKPATGQFRPDWREPVNQRLFALEPI